MRMRIAMIVSPLAPVPPNGAGPEQQVMGTLAEGLIARGHEVTLYASGDSQTPARLRAIRPRAILRSLDDLRARLALGDGTQAALLSLVSELSLEHLTWSFRDAVRAGAEVIHSQGLHGALMQRDLGIPQVTTIHGALPLDAAGTRRYLQALIDEADGLRGVEFVCISASQRASWPAGANARVIHHGVDASAFPLGAGPRRYLLHLGRLAWQKGTDLAILAARRAGVPLKIAGPKAGPLADPAFFARHVRPHLDGVEVEYVGEADHAARVELYQGAIALVAPLQWDEPFGMVFVEAMACGTPVLAFRRGAVPELVRDGVSGFVVDDLDALRARIPDAARLAPEAVRAHVVASFPIDRMVLAYEQAYRDAIARF